MCGFSLYQDSSHEDRLIKYSNEYGGCERKWHVKRGLCEIHGEMQTQKWNWN